MIFCFVAAGLPKRRIPLMMMAGRYPSGDTPRALKSACRNVHTREGIHFLIAAWTIALIRTLLKRRRISDAILAQAARSLQLLAVYRTWLRLAHSPHVLRGTCCFIVT
ncbi:uncharacterized protein ARMOST_06094 [Armillaria ostoyae]|uniref:Uncharacterized protein n=1 Tax=Armillaria ostoyae TaxID=47428 RepID=A0A284R221_ARMOS|nr:uncharacterized protein ARMOST_06094 [Armillaria ostoyae]